MYQKKQKTGLALTPECVALMDRHLHDCRCRSRNDLAEKAIRGYIAQTLAGGVTDQLAALFDKVSSDAVAQMEARMASVLYKIALELAQVNLLLVEWLELEPGQINRVVGHAVKRVNKNHGFVSLKQAGKMD